MLSSAAVPVSGDPHAWLRPIFAQLQAHPAFRQFAPAHQFVQLIQAVERDHPSKAAQMRESSVAAQHMLLDHLTSCVDQKAAAQETELWRVCKGDRELRCAAHYLPNGIDVRLMEGDDFRRTRLVRDRPEAQAVSQQWRTALLDRGWQSTLEPRAPAV